MASSSAVPTIDSIPVQIIYRPLERIRNHETLEHYCPGGYHPVAHWDLLGQSGRFFVMRKLGYGGFGIVWMCWDRRFGKLRAVKIMRADTSKSDSSEASLLALLSEGGDPVSAEEAYKHHLGAPLEWFQHSGPNGEHLCLVMPLLGPNVLNVRTLGDVDFVKDACAQITSGLAFLHGKGMAHGDLHLGNILIQTIDDIGLDGIDSLMMPCLQETLIAEEYGGPGPHAPKHIYECLDWTKVDSKYFKKEIAIIDFGSCFKNSKPPERPAIHKCFQAPEQFFNFPISQASDLWALGCLMLCILGSGNPFLWSETKGSRSLIPKWEDALGPLPQLYRSRLPSTTGSEGAAIKRKHDEISESVPVSPKKFLQEAKERRREEMGTEDILSSILAVHDLLFVPAS